MFKKLTAIAILVISIPVAAYAGAWTLNTWARSVGGTISVTGGSAYRVTDGSQFTNYTGVQATNTYTVTITPDSGYTANFFKNQTGNTSQGITGAETPNGTATHSSPGTITITSSDASTSLDANFTGSLASVWAVFKQDTIAVTATPDAGSTVNLPVVNGTSLPNVYTGTVAPKNIVFIFTAKPGYVITGVTGATGFTVSNNGSFATVTIPKNYAFSSALSFAATSLASTTVTTPNAGVSQAIGNGATATLAGTYVGPAPAFQNWSCVAKPTGAAQPFAKATGASKTTPALTTNGTYVFQYRVSNTSRALTSVTVYATATPTNLSVGTTCQACHNANGIDDPTINARYVSGNTHVNSTHSACTMCHNGTGFGGHPGNVNDQTVDNKTFVTNFANINGGIQQAGSEGVPSFVATAGSVFCAYCHNSASPYGVPLHVSVPLIAGVTCTGCHTSATGATVGTGDAHSIQPLPSCVACHAIGQAQVNATLVNDNSGVRAITGTAGEFGASTRNNVMGYRSHHIYNGAADPQDAQCIACHLEGKASKRAVSVDAHYHMNDGKVHLRDCNITMGQSESLAGDFAWDPAAPNHKLMDQFCMSCHNAAGAVTAYKNMSTGLKGMTAISGALPLSPTNPFGDQLTNAYDQKVRPGVVDVYSQFNTNNPSHHAVLGKKYTGRTRTAADPRIIASPTTFANNSGAGNAAIHLKGAALASYQYFNGYSSSTAPAVGNGSGSNFPGVRQTLYDAGFFVANYTTLDGNTLGDDSQLHCGDCHSVGQWKNGSAQAVKFTTISTSSALAAPVVTTTAVIGAHGSQNEYMLRTSDGSDSLQMQTLQKAGFPQTTITSVPKQYTVNGTYVCYLCHKQQVYGDGGTTTSGNTMLLKRGLGATVAAGSPHNGIDGSGNCNGTKFSGYGYKGTARYGVLVSGSASPAMGNLFAMTCAHCHNSGQQNFGGIHGANTTYVSYSTNGIDVAGTDFAAPGVGLYQSSTDADGSAYKLNAVAKPSYRFMGGESIRYQGGATASKWEAQALSPLHREGCYNLSQTADKTHLWNTTQPQDAVSSGNAAIVNNHNGDSSWGLNGNDYTSANTDQGSRYAQNNTSTGWGSCNHHQGSTTVGPTSPTRTILRPLVY